MVTAVDTSILLDLLCGSETESDRAEQSLLTHSQRGSLIISECVLAELRPALTEEDLRAFLLDWGIEFVPCSFESAIVAGEMYEKYLRRKGPHKRVVADFLIGAHAQLQAQQLLARDRGYWRDYFSELQVVER